MHILFIVEHYYPYIGGAEELWKTLAEHLVRENNHVTVLTTRFDKQLRNEEIINGVNIIRLNVSNRYAFTFFSIYKAVKLARKVDIIHTSSYNAALPAWIASGITSTHCVITFHEVWGKLWFNLPGISLFLRIGYSIFEKILLKLNFDRFIAVSDFTLNELRKAGVKEEKSIRIYNGLNYAALPQITADKNNVFTFCYYGRLGLSKGYQFLLPAVAELKKHYPQFQLKLIVPKHPLKALNKLKKAADTLGISDHIKWFHDLRKEELYREVKGADAVIIPSLSEGFCFVAAESVALNVPIISSQKGALAEVVSGRFIVIRSLDVSGLAKAMYSALLQEWEFIPPKYFTIENTVNNYVRLYTEIIGVKKK